MVGFETQYHRVRVENRYEQRLTFRLEPVVVELAQVEVSSERPRRWEERLKRFTRMFLGESDNAKENRILNPEVLSFSDTGKTSFEPLEPQNRREERRWRRNRTRAYAGSLRHFLEVLASGSVSAAGFSMYVTPEPDLYRMAPGRSVREEVPRILVSPDAVLYDEGADFERVLRFEHYICIIYHSDPQESRFYGQRGLNPILREGNQISWITLNPRLARTGVVFDVSGHIYDPYGLVVHGHLSSHRVAELLPWDYVPGK